MNKEERRSNDPSSTFLQEQHASDLQMLRVWQRIDKGKWIVGLLVKNVSKMQVCGGKKNLTKLCVPCFSGC